MNDAIPRILIVDDVPTNIHILGDTLAADYQLHVALNGPQALQLAEECRPDLVLLDIMMPGMDGFEVFRRLRALEALASVPIIFVTALESQSDESAGLQLGAADYITKPYNPEIVRLRVRNHLVLARQRASLKEKKDQLENRNEVLRNALAQIKRLEGIIPICMCCKKIRDDQDSWQQLENYITEHSDALFNHGLCPHCTDEELEKSAAVGGLAPATREGEKARQLRPSEQDGFRVLCDSSPIGMFRTDSNGENVYCNPRMEQITGRSAAENLGRGWDNNIHPEDRPERARFWNALVAGGCAGSNEYRLLNPNGETSKIRVLVSPCKDPDGSVHGFVGTVEDITGLSQAREEMIKIQKLESLGLLAGGIAHDFNNILTGIIGNISLAQGAIEASSEAQSALLEAERASERAVGLSRQLLNFAGGGEPVIKPVSVSCLVHEAVTMALRGSNVQGALAVPEGIGTIEVDEEQMLQGISNVVINAAQAMPEGGKVTVSAEAERFGAMNRLGLAPGDYVKIVISDAGCGIPESDLGKISDPYFSTKANGTGLGLTSTYAIIAKHKGHVGVHSVPGKGAAFTLYLPSFGAPVKAADPERRLPGAAFKKGAPILVMDDEEMIRTIASKMLESAGYQVVTCGSGTEAIGLYAAAHSAGNPFEAVIMDLTIAGGMGGGEAARQILALDPGARLVVSSGYCHDPVMAHCTKHGFCAVLPKPYKASDIAAVLSGIFSGTVGP